ncbi:mannose-1-phosphate guanylyltransferase/mannose-6-phosphate isomerase [Congregibacter litoralis]|uniref:mannose-1-phosphate guanylyltransferase n=1 Tax=Congregibacter litoralis KT71 TaxID=314285 RepID=A4A650_9GAMM|nr:mannose-1-phosphate guanylyltransferase/mannose-6-phosphate isomerase [Congregibacter litoralis]EAQ98497.2 mannose-1-phosphate guanylyltransferase (GDP)/mannose-6-phosphate isomerase, type 2 [Congregibacter litoralis KT71]
MLIPVLLSGGVGSRLWPVSREAYPKQFLALASELSMLQDTMARTSDLESAPPLVICNDEHRFMVAEQLRQLSVDPAAIILEPEGRNTAPAVALAAFQAVATDPDALLLVLPADHVIRNPESFTQAVKQGLSKAASGALMTFGVVPDAAETGYGYLRLGERDGDGLFALDSFVEKPDAETAKQYLESGQYHWNSGMFLLSASVYLDELKTHAPDIHSACERAMANAIADLDFLRPDKEAFLGCPSDSIDYAVMERTQRGGVIPLDCGWSDVGAWSTLWQVSERDGDGNVLLGDVMIEGCSDSYLRSESRLIAATGIKNLIVVETPDAILVADRDEVQNVKQIVNRLKAEGRSEASLHQRVYRPWGSYESLIEGDRFQVKRIVVNPGQTLSLQMHHHRAEHWIVVHGTAEVTCEDRVFTLVEDQSTYIPLGHKHRLANPGKIPVELIEVQSGSYLGEDDIVRFEDVYGRSS